MNQKSNRKNCIQRILAIILSLLMLLQTFSVFAEDIEIPENTPAETAATVSEDAEKAADAEVPAEGDGTAAEEADGEGGEPAEGSAEVPEQAPEAPATEPVFDISESITMMEAGYVPAPPYFDGTLVYEGADYTVTAVIGPDAMFPEDVQIRVEEILPGTEQYELYTQIMEETLEEGEELGEFARYFDISFIAVIDDAETEIEPQANINVQITFQETIALTEESDVQAVHIAENTPEILETVTDSLEAAANDDEAIDTVTFSADSFSVYGVVQKIKKILKVITASGESFTVDVTYTSDANIPEDAELIATEITPDDPNYNTYREQTALALGADDVRLPGLFDLGIYINGEKIQPEAPVSVAISLNEGIQEGEKLYVVHFPEGIEAAQESVEEAPKLMAAPRMMRAAAPMTQPDAEQQAAEQADAEAAEPETKTETPAVATEVSEATVEGETITFEANGFSVYALAYTIEVYYRTAEGETYLITLNYSENAGIPENAELAVREILPGDEGYENYYAEAANTATADAVNRGIDVPMIAGARMFDIEILADGEKIEPAAPVQVSIRLMTTAADMLSVVHFAETGTESIVLSSSTPGTAVNDDSDGTDSGTEEPVTISEVSFEADSFSVYSVVSVTDFASVAGNGPYALVTGIAGDPGPDVGYWHSEWGETDYFTKIVNAMAMVDDESNNGIASTGVHVWLEGNQGYVGGAATTWYFESTGDGNYYIKNSEGKYLRWTSYYNGYGQQQYDGLSLTENSGERTAFRIESTNAGDGTVYIRLAQDLSYYIHNNGSGEWASRNYMLARNPNDASFRFKICKESDDFESFSAVKTEVSALTTADNFLIYRKFVDSNGQETLFALAHDGTFVRVYDGGDSVYWRETDKNLYWNYQRAEDGGYHIYTHAPGSTTPIFINPVSSTGQIFSDTPGGLTLAGRENGDFGTAIEQWDQTAYDYAGLHVTKDASTGEATLSAGKRTNGTSDEFLFALKSTMPGVDPIEVSTVDSEALGIHITMYDYLKLGEYHQAGYKDPWMTGVVGSGSDAYKPHAANALVRKYLENGVPVNNAGSSLGALFPSSTNGDNVSYVQSGVTNLFLQSYYQENGTFRYRSEDNYAYLPRDGSKEFKVYRQTATPYTSDVWVGWPYYYHGHFMPFNDIDTSNNLSRLLDQYGTGEIPIDDGRTYEDVYGIKEEPNFYTGMKMEANFSQPRDGKVKSGDDMVFKFTGDDDMWVYIDDVLILDIGGIHEPLSGTINFATGVVTNPPGSSLPATSTIRDLFILAANDNNTPQATRAKLWAFINEPSNWKGNTFADYTNHKFNAFYMERGAGASNLDIQFNLKVKLVDEFSVKKELPEEIDPRYANEKYQFQALFKDDTDNNAEKPLFPGTLKSDGSSVCIKVIYKDLKDTQGNEVAVPVDDNGYFYLRAGEEAIFKMEEESTEYCVKEIFDEETNSSVVINGDEQNPFTESPADPDFERVHNRGELNFKNHPYTQDLLITKHITKDSAAWQSDNPVFEFRVYLESEVEDTTVTPSVKVQKLVPYSQGPYYLIKNGEYYTLTGENNAPVKVSPDPSIPTICSYSGRSGSINSIPPEYTIVIPNLTVGTHFYIEERLDNIPEGYKYVYEELTDGTYDIQTMYMGALDNENVQSILARNTDDTQAFDPTTIGKIKKGTDAESHIYNRKPKADITINVEKLWGNNILENDPALKDSSVKVIIGRYLLTEKAGNFTIEKAITVKGDNTNPSNVKLISKYTITGTDIEGNDHSFGPYVIYGNGTAAGTLPPGTYTVQQEIYSEDPAYSWVHSTTSVSLTIEDEKEGNPTPVTFPSTATVKTGSLSIFADLTDGGSGVASSFSNVTYTILDENGTRAKNTSGQEIADIQWSNGLCATIDNLKVGTYTVVENNGPETPQGFRLSAKVPSSDRLTVQVTESTTPAEARFSRTYAPDRVSSSVVIKKFDRGDWQYDYYPDDENPIHAPLNKSGTISWTPDEPVDFVLYLNNAGWNRLSGSQGTGWSAKYNGNDISLISSEPVNGQDLRAYTFRINRFTQDGILELGVNAQEDAWPTNHVPYELREVSRTATLNAGGRRLLSAGPLRGANYTSSTIEPPTYGNPPTLPETSVWKYVDDAGFNKEIILNQSNNWKGQFSDRPVQEDVDGVSYTYYYYIKEVKETGMPEGTTCAVKLNGDNTFLVSEDNISESLSVTNTVPKGSIEITKTALKDGDGAAEAGTTWYYAVYSAPYNTSAASQTPLTTGSITVGANGTGTAVIGNLLYGQYYVYELTGENGTPIVCENGSRVLHVFDRTVYRVSSSGAEATVNSTSVPATVSLRNERETVSVAVHKVWEHGANTNIPESIVMRLSNGTEVTLNEENSWTAEVSGLPKIDQNGNLIEYSWTEGSLPAGYYLASVEDTTDDTTGIVTTTFTNAYTDHYMPETEIKGVKIWQDDGDTANRPSSITVNLYKNDGEEPYDTKTVSAPSGEEANQDQWPFEFTNLPVFNEDGTVIQYHVEEVLPEAYRDLYAIVELWNPETVTYNPGVITGQKAGHGNNSSISLCNGTNLGWIVLKDGNKFTIWTPRKISDNEKNTIRAYVNNLDGFSGITDSGANITYADGVPTNLSVKHNKTIASVSMNGDTVKMNVLHMDNSFDLAYGRIPYTYTQVGGENGGTITNIKKVIDIIGTKTWVDGGRTHDNAQEITLVLKRTIPPVTDDSEWTTVDKTPTWSGNTYTYTNLERYPDIADLETEYVYKVEETAVNVTEGEGEEQHSIAYASTSDGNNFTNTELTNIEVTKTWKNGDNSVNDAITNASVTFELQKMIGDDNWEKVEQDGLDNPVIMSVTTEAIADAWKAAWNNLPKYELINGTSTLIKYRVVETAATASDVSLTPSEPVDVTAGTIVNIDNYLPVDITIVKVDADDPSKPMTGAEFKLYKKNAEDNSYNAIGDAKPVDGNGVLVFEHLTNGDYRIKETKAPAGYVPLADPIDFTITNGSVTYNGSSNMVVYEPETDPKTFTVKNKPGAALPSTGGIGTVPFTLLGLLLIIAAGTILLLKKRKA